MKGCARSLLLQLGGFLAILAGVFAFLQLRHGLAPARVIGPAFFSALFGWVGLGWLAAIRKPVRERAALAGCLAGRRPADGKWTGIAGTIEAAGALLRSPLTGTECLAYRYEIYLWVGQGRRRTRAVYFEGVALVPSVISTPAGSFRLLAVPEFDFGREDVDPKQALFHWSEHVKTAAFETPEAARKTLAKQWTDDDGAYRSEKRHPVEGEIPLEECKYHEDLIKKGDRVYAVGLFSESRGGIVPHANWAHHTRIMKGDPDSILRQLRSRTIRYAIGGVVFLGVAGGILAAFLSHAGVL
jgi:hypothetical protein